MIEIFQIPFATHCCRLDLPILRMQRTSARSHPAVIRAMEMLRNARTSGSVMLPCRDGLTEERQLRAEHVENRARDARLCKLRFLPFLSLMPQLRKVLRRRTEWQKGPA